MQSQNKVSPPKTGVENLLWAQAQVVFNDNAAKLSLIGLANLVLVDRQQVDAVTNLCAALLVLPFILFSPICGWFSDRFPKTTVLRQALALQIAVMGVIIVGLVLHQLGVAILGFFLLAIQATIFSPAKQGILKELVGSQRLNRAASLMEASTIVAILVGALGGGVLLDQSIRWTGQPWTGGIIDLTVLVVLCWGAWFLVRGIPRQPAQMQEPFRWALFWEHFAEMGRLGRQPNLLGAALGVAWFYSLGGLFYLILVQVGREMHVAHLSQPQLFDLGATTDSGLLFGCIGLGIISGAILYNLMARSRVSLQFTPFCAVLMTLSLAVLSWTQPTNPLFALNLFILGLSGGMFVVPLNAYLQDRSQPQERGRILAATNLITNIGGLTTVAIHWLLADSLNLSVRQQIGVTAAANLLMTLVVVFLHRYQFLRILLQGLARCLYRIQLRGQDWIPEQGGVLLVSNHVSYVDAFLIPLVCQRPVRFLAFEDLFKVPVLGWVMKTFGTIPISPQRSKEALNRAKAALQQGEVVCIFPEGELTRTGKIMGFKRGFEVLARQAQVPVIPVHLDSLWGSIFSFSGGRYFWKLPQEIPRRVRISFGEPIEPSSVKAEDVRRRVLILGEAAFRDHSDLGRSLGRTAVERLLSEPQEVFMIDCTGQPQAVTGGEILVAALFLARLWKREIRGQRVGIALPPSRGAVVANLAVVLAGKIPVNLNLTASFEAAAASINRAEIAQIITAPAVQAYFSKFPWTEKIIDIGSAVKSLPRWRLATTLLSFRLLPSWLICTLWGIDSEGGDREAALLFTSGSSGYPKGVPLTHRNIQANVAQVGSIDLAGKTDRILGCLPLFHSFGFTFTLWLPLLREIGLVTTPSPTDARKVGEAVQAGRATILLGTPTFFRSYARKVSREQFSTLRLAVAGAEKLPPDLAELYDEKYQLEIMEGYGLTETSPTLSLNVPHPLRGPAAESQQKGHVRGSVGRLLPGVAYQLVDPETGEVLLPGAVGLLQVKGANIFGGYLADVQRTAEVLRDGWFTTGDLARVDEDGFLFIEGRLSRFAKIAGEMVPLVKIEEAVVQVLSPGVTEGALVAVVSLPHPTKGESLVLLTAIEVDWTDLRKKLVESGLPNLWIPKVCQKVGEIPIMGSGKIDLRACQELARAQSGGEGTP